jgi:hypothetical protein
VREGHLLYEGQMRFLRGMPPLELPARCGRQSPSSTNTYPHFPPDGQAVGTPAVSSAPSASTCLPAGWSSAQPRVWVLPVPWGSPGLRHSWSFQGPEREAPHTWHQLLRKGRPVLGAMIAGSQQEEKGHVGAKYLLGCQVQLRMPSKWQSVCMWGWGC